MPHLWRILTSITRLESLLGLPPHICPEEVIIRISSYHLHLPPDLTAQHLDNLWPHLMCNGKLNGKMATRMTSRWWWTWGARNNFEHLCCTFPRHNLLSAKQTCNSWCSSPSVSYLVCHKVEPAWKAWGCESCLTSLLSLLSLTGSFLALLGLT